MLVRDSEGNLVIKKKSLITILDKDDEICYYKQFRNSALDITLTLKQLHLATTRKTKPLKVMKNIPQMQSAFEKYMAEKGKQNGKD